MKYRAISSRQSCNSQHKDLKYWSRSRNAFDGKVPTRNTSFQSKSIFQITLLRRTSWTCWLFHFSGVSFNKCFFASFEVSSMDSVQETVLHWCRELLNPFWRTDRWCACGCVLLCKENTTASTVMVIVAFTEFFFPDSAALAPFIAPKSSALAKSFSSLSSLPLSKIMSLKHRQNSLSEPSPSQMATMAPAPPPSGTVPRKLLLLCRVCWYLMNSLTGNTAHARQGLWYAICICLLFIYSALSLVSESDTASHSSFP